MADTGNTAPMTHKHDPRIIVALDVADMASALEISSCLDPALCRLKVGKELYTRVGPAAVEALKKPGFGIFLDLKFHDIPKTVAGACRAAAELGVWMVNVHATGGREMMAEARDAIEGHPFRPLLTGVTVLTSLDEKDVAEIGYADTPANTVLRLARLAENAGLDGIVCSPRELGPLQGAVGDAFLRITPGIRPAKTSLGDQKRVMTPGEAVGMGAHYLVIGRPITGARDPVAALKAITAEIDEALAKV